MKRISEHYDERDVGYSFVAQRLNIVNLPSEEVLRNAAVLAEKVLEPLRSALGFIHVHSWYRSPALERALCKQDYYQWCVTQRRIFSDEHAWLDYLRTKQHPTGCAVDIRAREVNIKELYNHIKANLEFDVLKIEYGVDEIKESGLVHVSYVEGKNRSML